MSLQDIDPQFRLDSDVAPTYVVKDYDIETGEFGVYYNDGTLKNDEWYGPIIMDLGNMQPEEVEPLRFQVADMVYAAVENSRCEEVDMSGSLLALNSILDVEQSVPMIDLMKHHEEKAKANPNNVDPIAGAINATQVINVYNEDDFDLQFEARTQALAEEDAEG